MKTSIEMSERTLKVLVNIKHFSENIAYNAINRFKEITSKINEQKRKKNILKTCGNICYCPNCKNPLNDSSDYIDDENGVRYICGNCDNVSIWNFDIAPVPILMCSENEVI